MTICSPEAPRSTQIQNEFWRHMRTLAVSVTIGSSLFATVALSERSLSLRVKSTSDNGPYFSIRGIDVSLLGNISVASGRWKNIAFGQLSTPLIDLSSEKPYATFPSPSHPGRIIAVDSLELEFNKGDIPEHLGKPNSVPSFARSGLTEKIAKLPATVLAVNKSFKVKYGNSELHTPSAILSINNGLVTASAHTLRATACAPFPQTTPEEKPRCLSFQSKRMWVQGHSSKHINSQFDKVTITENIPSGSRQTAHTTHFDSVIFRNSDDSLQLEMKHQDHDVVWTKTTQKNGESTGKLTANRVSISPFLTQFLPRNAFSGAGPLQKLMVLPQTGQTPTISANISWKKTTALHLQGTASWSHLPIQYQRITAHPVALSGSLSGTLTIAPLWTALPKDSGVSIASKATISLGDVKIDFQADALWKQKQWQTISFLGKLTEVDCQDALLSVPAELRARLSGLQLSGILSGNTELTFYRQKPKHDKIQYHLDNHCTVVRDAAFAHPHTIQQLAKAHTSQEIPQHIISAIIAAEDGQFLRHNGFDPEQIKVSIFQNLRAGEIIRGGSTLSQQLVKNAYLDHSRSASRKLEEAVLAWRIEQVVSKSEIINAYLSIVEMGPGIFGIDKATQYWFHTSPANIGPLQAAFLASLLRSPKTTSRQIHKQGTVPKATIDRIRRIAQRMRPKPQIPASDLQIAKRLKAILTPREKVSPQSLAPVSHP